MTWDHRQYASADDPARQSDLNDIASPHGCSKRFYFRKSEEADGRVVERHSAPWRRVNGSAIHKLIERTLAPHVWSKLAAGGEELIRQPRFFARLQELYPEALEDAAEGLAVDWGRDNPDAVRDDACTMVREVLVDLLGRIERPLAVEAPFRVAVRGQRDRDYHLQGTIDLVYEPKGLPGQVGFLDWKSGQLRMHPIVLAHGYQAAIYAHAVELGTFWPGTEREVSFGQFPSEIWIVHLRELLPYAKRTTFTLERTEEVEWVAAAVRGELPSVRADVADEREADRVLAHLGPGSRVEVEPTTAPPPRTKKNGEPYKSRARSKPPLVKLIGDRRGPAWYAAHRSPDDVARLRVSLDNIVGTVRLGRFFESIGDQCGRCAFRSICLNEGHEVDRSEMTQVNRALAGVELDELTNYAV